MDQYLAVDPARQVPQVVGTDALDMEAVRHLAEHCVDQVARVAVGPFLAVVFVPRRLQDRASPGGRCHQAQAIRLAEMAMSVPTNLLGPVRKTLTCGKHRWVRLFVR